MIKNKLHESFILCLILIGGLLSLYVVPEFAVGSLTFKRVDLLSDIRKENVDSTPVAIYDSITVKQDSTVKGTHSLRNH